MTPAFVHPRPAAWVDTRADTFTFHRVAEPAYAALPRFPVDGRLAVRS